jgi:hypothetical protein
VALVPCHKDIISSVLSEIQGACWLQRKWFRAKTDQVRIQQKQFEQFEHFLQESFIRYRISKNRI